MQSKFVVPISIPEVDVHGNIKHIYKSVRMKMQDTKQIKFCFQW